VAQVVGILGLVANQHAGCGGAGEHGAGPVDVVALAWRQEQGVEPALFIGERVELACRPAARAADRLALLAPFSPAAARCARAAVLSTMATTGRSSLAARAAEIPYHSPGLLQRLKRLDASKNLWLRRGLI